MAIAFLWTSRGDRIFVLGNVRRHLPLEHINGDRTGISVKRAIAVDMF